jgi:hypothetical protein
VWGHVYSDTIANDVPRALDTPGDNTPSTPATMLATCSPVLTTALGLYARYSCLPWAALPWGAGEQMSMSQVRARVL